MRQPHVWMLGDWEQAEFATALAYLRREANLDLLTCDVRGSGVFGVDVFAGRNSVTPKTPDPYLTPTSFSW